MFCLLGFASFLMPAYCLCLTQKIQPLMYSELNNQRRFPVCEKNRGTLQTFIVS